MELFLLVYLMIGLIIAITFMGSTVLLRWEWEQFASRFEKQNRKELLLFISIIPGWFFWVLYISLIFVI